MERRLGGARRAVGRWLGSRGQATTEYLVLAGICVALVLAVLRILVAPIAMAVVEVARRSVLFLSS